MRNARSLTLLLLLISLFCPPPAFAGKSERLQEELDDAKRDLRTRSAEVTKARGELARAESELSVAKSRLEENRRRFPDELKLSPEDLSKREELRSALADALAKRDELKLRIDLLLGEADALKAESRRLEKQIDRAEELAARGSECVDCQKAKKPGQDQRSGWDGFANVVKAITPLGLGAMSLYGSVKAMDQQSADYQLYANTMAQNGLPFAQNQASYANLLGGMNMFGMGGTSGMFGMNGMYGLGGMYGMGANNMFAGYGYGNMMGGFNLYGNSLGSSNFGYNSYAYPSVGFTSYGYGGYNTYNAWSGNTGAYGADAYGAYLRQQQQGTISATDAQTAGYAYQEAYRRYQQAIGSGGSYYNGYYNGGSYYSPAVYSPSVNGTRQ